MGLAFLLYLLGGLSNAVAQDSCFYTQNVNISQPYYITSPNYPDTYEPGTRCRWVATCPSGYVCKLDCYEVSLPDSPNCQLDQLMISKTGDPQLYGADVYCGRGSFVTVSAAQKISVGLITSSNSTGGRFAARVYAEKALPDNTCACGLTKTPRIVGGVETGVNEFSFMAGVVDTSLIKIRCGGTIISEIHILTAAHCLEIFRVNETAVVVGEHNVNEGAESDVTQGIMAARFIIHPNYNSVNFDNDIGIIVLWNSIKFDVDGLVGTVCLPYKYANADMAGQKVTLLGWGTQEIGGLDSKVLRKVNVDVMSQNSCRKTVATLTDNQICTYTPGKDSCQDDSGGPAIYTDRSTGLAFILGIISFGRFCAEDGQPGISTRVVNYLDWIEKNTNMDYCKK